MLNFVAKFEMVEELFVVSDAMVDDASAKYASDCGVAGRRFSPCRHGDCSFLRGLVATSLTDLSRRYQ